MADSTVEYQDFKSLQPQIKDILPLILNIPANHAVVGDLKSPNPDNKGECRVILM
jgi:hypothetical protein